MKYIISTLGCKVNQYETQAMETMLLEHGHEPAAPGEIADAVIVNTCAVTAESGRKSRQTIRRLRDENPSAVIAVCGCYSQLDPDAVAKTGADVIFGSNDHAGMVAALENALGTGEHSTSIDEPFKRRVFEQLPAGAVAGRTRAMLKIQDGCVNFCTYCIIPYTRGRLRSLPLDAAAAETARIDAEGYREIVLTGIEVASYGVDLPGKPGLADVIETVAASAPDMRIRLGSLEPTVITEDFCRRLAATGRLCRHFHLSLQSGCDRTLKAMNRKYDTAGFYRAVELLREYFPGCALTADLICGFPGETEEDFRESCAFLKEIGFLKVHVFPYSRRSGTPAYNFPDQVHEREKQARSREMNAIAEDIRREVLAGCEGSEDDVLLETPLSGTLFTGYTRLYVPVVVSAPGHKSGEIVHVRLGSYDGERVRAEMV